MSLLFPSREQIRNRVQLGGAQGILYSLHDLPSYVPEAHVSWIDRQYYQDLAGPIAQGFAERYYALSGEARPSRVAVVLLAIWMEFVLSKDELLELYMTSLNYGEIVGIDHAAAYYFGEHAQNLSLGRTACLVGISDARLWSQDQELPRLCAALVPQVTEAMREASYITPEQEEVANAERLVFFNGRLPQGPRVPD